MPDANPAASILCEPAESKCTWTCHKRHFVRKSTGKMLDANPTASILYEPAKSKCIYGHVTRGILCGNLQGKCWTLIPRQAFCKSLHSRNAYMDMSQRHFVRKFTGKMSNAPDTTSIEHRALTVSVRTPVWGTNVEKPWK